MFLLNEYSWGVTLKPKLGTGFPVTALILLQKKKKKSINSLSSRLNKTC